MWNNKFVISISGHGECGKDTVAALIHKHSGLPYKKSTSACVVDPWWDEIQAGKWSANTEKIEELKHLTIEPDYYFNKKEFYDDRRNRRMDWVDYIEWFNANNGNLGVGLYSRAVETGNQILTGIRRTGQFKKCLKHIIDVSIWVDRPNVSVDESQEYGPELCDYIILNDGTIEDLENKIVETHYWGF